MPDLTRQAEQLLQDAGLDVTENVTPAVQTSDARQIAILADLEDGRDDYRAIAQRHGVSVRTVYRMAARAETFSEAARNYLRTREFKAIGAWDKALDTAAQRGDHRPARDLLLHTGLIEPLADTSGQRGPQVAIIIGTPEQPIRVTSSKD